MLPKEELLLIIYFVVVISLLTVIVILFFITFQRRKNKLLFEKFENQKRFEQEIAQSRLEIQEQTLKNVSWELHDNIGQLLSVANMQLNILSRTENNNPSVKEVKEIVGTSLQEVRALSRSLNKEVIDYIGLEDSVKNEVDRFNRLNIVKTEFITSGEKFDIPAEDAVILFRILQEAFSNTIKHSRAANLVVRFLYKEKELLIRIQDDGEGFDQELVKKNSGLINMESRARLIGAGYTLDSSVTGGTSLNLQYPKKNPANE